MRVSFTKREIIFLFVINLSPMPVNNVRRQVQPSCNKLWKIPEEPIDPIDFFFFFIESRARLKPFRNNLFAFAKVINHFVHNTIGFVGRVVFNCAKTDISA